MTHIILHISDSDKHFSDAIAEYTKRLGKSVVFDAIKPFKDGNRDLVIKKETEKLIEKIQQKYSQHQKILLIKEGKVLTTEELSNLSKGKDTVWIIWGPYGVDRQIFSSTFPEAKEVSFWAITLPHGLAKLVLIEQIYRIGTIESGKTYHY